MTEPKFIVDVHLGRMAKYLRMLGFDTLYETGYEDNTIIDISIAEDRIILTRDKLLLKSKRVVHGIRITSDDPEEQVREVVVQLSLGNQVKPFSRCIVCNHVLEEVQKSEVEAVLPERTRQYYETFWICRHCGRVYWEGSHFERMKMLADSLTK